MPVAQIQAAADAIAAQQVPNQFGTQRYALLFKPGTYGSAAQPLKLQVGYYTEVAGLGASPRDVTINGAVDVYNQCDADGCIALTNFWRSLSNLTINVTGPDRLPLGRRVLGGLAGRADAAGHVTGGNVSLMDYCSAGPQYASGGFIADSTFSGGTIINGSQQQFLVRNSELGGWNNGVWNQVFSGVRRRARAVVPVAARTRRSPTTPASRERPFLYLDAARRLRVFVPARPHGLGRHVVVGRTRRRALAAAERFFVARPSDSPRRINQELARGRNLLLTPGVYDIDRTLDVRRPGTVVLGLGMATLTAERGAVRCGSTRPAPTSPG